MLFVPVAVPSVVRVTASVAVPALAGMTFRRQVLNCAWLSMSKDFFASFFITLWMMSRIGCSDKSSSLPV